MTVREPSNWSDALAPRWPALSELLDEALALPVEARDAWLAALDGDRASHRDLLRTLLDTQARVETEDFLGVLPHLPESGRAPTDGLSTGQRVGPYQLLGLLGCGGMGTVWLAERSDAMTKRRVALKLPRIAWGDAFVERLAREREILATLEHEHIARLYDAGVDAQGRPYLAMEYVEGETIDVWCRTRDLSLEARLELLLQVMSAVAHAHAMLVVHRDLKPGNILVTAEGRVRLLDFGVAKLLEGDLTRETVLTEFAGRALTLDYASPEQVRGEPLGTASDIYSMAIVAFELLAGERPYPPRGGAHLAGRATPIASPGAPLASARARDRRTAERLRGDLDAILNKAMKDAPADRYSTMDAFAQDLRRHLAGEPVEAQPDRFGYRAARFVRRHRVQVTAGATVVLALVIGLTVALWQAREARDQARRAEREATTARAVQSFLESVFTTNTIDQADPAQARDTTARQLLDRGAERIDTELRDAPEARLRLLNVLGDLYEQMQATDRHIALRREALVQAESLDGPAGEQTVLQVVRLAHALTFAEQRAEAADLLKRADGILQARGNPPSYARFRVDVMQASLERRTDPRHGLVLSERALAFARTRPPDSDLLLALRVMGDNARLTEAYGKARDAYAEIIRISEAQAPLGAGELGLAYSSLGETRALMGDTAAAETDLRKALAMEQARHADPQILFSIEADLARFLARNGRYREALMVSDPAWQVARHPGSPTELRGIRVYYARYLEAYGRVDEALDVFAADGSLTVEPATLSRLDLLALNGHARALIRAGRLDQARALMDRVRALLQQSAGRFETEESDTNESLWLAASGHGRGALTAWEAVRIAHQAPARPDASSSAGAETTYAAFALAAGESQSAADHATSALQKIAASGQADVGRDVEARARLIRGKALMQLAGVGEACPVIAQALQQNRAVFDPNHSPDVMDAVRTFKACKDSAAG